MALHPRRFALPPLERGKGGSKKDPSWASFLLPRRFAAPPRERGKPTGRTDAKRICLFHLSLLNDPARNSLGIFSDFAIIHSDDPQSKCLHLPVALGVMLLRLGRKMRFAGDLYAFNSSARYLAV